VLDEGLSFTEAAEVNERTVRKWIRRFQAEGEDGLLDRSSAPNHVHNRTPEDRVQAIAALRRLRFTETGDRGAASDGRLDGFRGP
jgi:transposase